MATPQQELLQLYENLGSKYRISTTYTIGISRDLTLSPDVIEFIKYLSKGDLSSTDMDETSFLKIVLTDKISGDYIATFEQNTNTYMEVFDQDELVDFLKEYNEYIKVKEKDPEDLERSDPEVSIDDFYE
jgi:hypothetical protein